MADRRPPRREGQSPRRPNQGPPSRGPHHIGGARRPRPASGPAGAKRPRPAGGPAGAGRPRPASSAARPDALRKIRPARSKDSGDDGQNRLQKILAHAGLGSRRACEELILQGRVTVDREVVRELGSKVDPRKCNIQVDGQTIKVEKLVYYAVNKPKGYVSTNADPSGRPRVIDLMPELPERVYTVGRLDEMSVGLILLTNDGELANKLTHPKYGVEKLYRVVVAGSPSQEVLTQLTEGIWLAEGKVRAKRARIVGHQGESSILEMVLAEGKNREVRRMLAKFGHKVMSLTRVAVGPVTLKGLKFGQWRVLTSYEVELLQKVASGIQVSMPWMMADRPSAPSAPRRGPGRTGLGGAGAAPHLGGPSADRDRRPPTSSFSSGPRPPRPAPQGTFPGRRPMVGGGPRFQDGPSRTGGRPPMNDGPRPPRMGDRPRRDDGPRPTGPGGNRPPMMNDRPMYGGGPRQDDRPRRDDGPRPNDRPPMMDRDRPRNDGPRPPQGGDGPRRNDGPRPQGRPPMMDRDRPRNDGPRPPRQGDGPRRDDGPRPNDRPRYDGPRQNDGPRPPMMDRDRPRNDGPRPNDRPRYDGPRQNDGPRPPMMDRDRPRNDGPRPNDRPRYDGPRPPMGDGPRRNDGPRPDGRPPMMRDRPRYDGPRPAQGDGPRRNDGPRPPRPDGRPPMMDRSRNDGPRPPRRDDGPRQDEGGRPPEVRRPIVNDGPKPSTPGRVVRPMKGDAPSPGVRIPLPDGLPPSQRPPGTGRPGRPGSSGPARRSGQSFSSSPPGRKIIGLQAESPPSGGDSPRPNIKRRPKPIAKPRRKGRTD